MEPHQQRVVDEQTELTDKVGKLETFIHFSPIFDSLEKSEQRRLIMQFGFMVSYSRILQERIDNFSK